ncbi:MAG: hypothetical protein CMB80_00810 [Flammeovirgaceae bacterium]|nr:hypothetical protein [Flammeovirgaceae bacterium]
MTEATIVALLASINEKLERVVKSLSGLSSRDEPDDTGEQDTPVLINESMGTCPGCGNAEIIMEGDYPRVIYKCVKCEVVWVNDENCWFKT